MLVAVPLALRLFLILAVLAPFPLDLAWPPVVFLLVFAVVRTIPRTIATATVIAIAALVTTVIAAPSALAAFVFPWISECG